MEKNWNDEDLLEQIHKLRHLLDTYQKQLEKGNVTVDRKDMREEMSRLNQLKLEARKRGLTVD